MYQARRDTIIRAQQHAWTKPEADQFLSLKYLQKCLGNCSCSSLNSASTLKSTCTVSKSGNQITCIYNDRTCPVRIAAITWGRMAHLGKVPVSAFHSLWSNGQIGIILTKAAMFIEPIDRLEFVVNRVTLIHGIGRKLATLFVSALSTPALAAGLTPWWPLLNGNLAVVLDTHAIRAIDFLSQGKAGRSYQSRVNWIRQIAKKFDLKNWNENLPSYSPRLVQQALYAFSSKSNRQVWGLVCADFCSIPLCPFESGSLPCISHNKVVAEYALRDMSKPMGVAKYQLVEALPENLKGSLPSIDDIEKELEMREGSGN
ncbi:MAG: DUF1016 family protein [Planctomycetes bacterium]|nr:DUF1016 family protein [Planctomycetota bacterium]